MALLKFSLKTNIVKSIFQEIFSKTSHYYYTYGKNSIWPTVTNEVNGETVIVSDENIAPSVVDSYSYEIETRRNMIYMKLIDSNDACIVVKRYNWVAGYTYDMYDDYSVDRPAFSGAIRLQDAVYYVMTTDFNVYKCLFNNNNKPSTIQPIGTSPDSFQTSDGYVWKFMYTIPLYLRNKFLNSSWMPVTTSLSNQFYSNGSIVDYTIEKPGAQYVKNTWKVKRIIILDGGFGYTSVGTTITFPAPISGTAAAAEVNAIGDLGNIESISVTNPGLGYDYQPQPTVVAATGSGLKFTVEYEVDGTAYTEIKVVGDGYNEHNPYTLKEVTILDRGSYIVPPFGDLFTFSHPQKTYGRMPRVNVTFRSIAGNGTAPYEVDQIQIIDEGYGYTEPLVFGQNVFAGPLTLDNSFDCDLNVDSQKNPATIVPLVGANGEIEGITITEPGAGYTYANVIVRLMKQIEPGIPGAPFVEVTEDMNEADPVYTPGFKKASIILNFGIGDIETKQSTVELLAVNGSIPIIVVEEPGAGYPMDTVIQVSGDGTGCQAVPIIDSGNIIGVNVTNPGQGYSYATVTTTSSGTSAVLRPIIAPKGGHGRDAVSELSAHTIMLTGRLGLEKLQGIPTDSDYRQITILKNPYVYGDRTFYRNANGSTTIKLGCEIVGTNTAAYNAYQPGDTLALASALDKTYVLVGKSTSSIDNKYYLIVTVNDNYIPTPGNILTNGSNSIAITTVTYPEVDKYSGEVLFIDNRIKFASSEEQTIITSTLISF